MYNKPVMREKECLAECGSEKERGKESYYGVYLNSKKPYLLYQEDSSAAYFVDKTDILKELVPLLERKEDANGNEKKETWQSGRKGNRYICITRPRRFGKTVMANMITSYFEKGVDSRDIFRNLKASSYDWFEKHLNKHNVIHIMFNETPRKCSSYEQYITRIESRLVKDLMREFPDVPIHEEEAVWDAFNTIIEFGREEKFIFVLDEWDFIFHRDFVTEADKEDYIDFLRNLLKDQPYVELAYMTGILPIAKYSSGSELNMFYEYTIVSMEKYSKYFGFTDEEVDELYERYLEIEQSPGVSREGLRIWYDGYQTLSGIRLYNPRSVVGALDDNQLGNYWTSSGPYDEIFSAMVVYGFLSYGDGYISIPNKELMDKFAEMVEKEPSLGYIHRLARQSERMLKATKAGDTETGE